MIKFNTNSKLYSVCLKNGASRNAPCQPAIVPYAKAC